jgi:CRP-like cAMP-binding protein
MPDAQNHLIELLPRGVRDRLLAKCESVDLVSGAVLRERGKRTQHVYFPVNGFISLLAQAPSAPAVEVGMIGREGMLGVELLLGVASTPIRALVQGAGSAWRIPAADFRRELAGNAAMTRLLGRYLHVVHVQLAASAACQRSHLLGPRLARWLLMSQDRAHADRFHVTHEFMATMLGVRRVGITVAARLLQLGGLVTYRRGDLTVLDRQGLEQAACTCYAAGLSSYRNVVDHRVA